MWGQSSKSSSYYGTGGFSRAQRETQESSQAIFATLIILLPAEYEGGTLVVRHRGEEKAGFESDHDSLSSSQLYSSRAVSILRRACGKAFEKFPTLRTTLRPALSISSMPRASI
jgi:hypothetical protein